MVLYLDVFIQTLRIYPTLDRLEEYRNEEEKFWWQKIEINSVNSSATFAKIKIIYYENKYPHGNINGEK